MMLVRLISNFIILLGLLFPLEYSDYGFEIFSLSGDAKIHSSAGCPHDYSMSINDLYTLNDFHKQGKLSFTYTNYYSGLVSYFQSSYIYKSTDKAKIGISFLHKEIKDIPNTQNAWADVGLIISQDQIDYSNIEFYDDRQVALIILYSSTSRLGSYGLKIKPIYTSLLDFSALGIAFDLGFNKAFNEKVKLGLNIENIFSYNRWSTGKVYSKNPKINLSNSYKGKSFYLMNEISIKYKQSSIDRVIYAFGLEKEFKNSLNLRFGYSDQTIALGVGFRYKDVFYSYSYSPQLKDIILGHDHQFSILLDLSKIKL
tara:strand:- start:136 stop:1074 length:939 start_codon:yes stop_codon:yes gene_type:complete